MVFDLCVFRATCVSWMGRLALDAIARRVAAAGEPFPHVF